MEDGQQAPANPAEAYESYFVPAMFVPLVTLLLERMQPQRGDRVLDVACGTGVVARQVAPMVRDSGRVIGIDPSPAMLAVAHKAAAEAGLAVQWEEGRAESIPFPDDSFDLVLCQMGLQFFPDKPAALREMRRVLAPGGRLAVSVWEGLEKHPVFNAANGSIERHTGVPAVAVPFSMGDPEELRALLADAGLDSISVEQVSFSARFADAKRFAPLQVQASAAVLPSLKAMDSDARLELARKVQEDVRPVLDRYTVDGRLELPMHALLAAGRRAAGG